MSTQVQPENQQNQENNSQENQQQPPENSQQAPTNNQPPQERQYTQEEMRTVHELYAQTLRENEQRLQNLQNQLTQQQQPQNNQQQQRNQEPDDFLSNGRNIVGEEIDRRLAPLVGFVQQTQAQTVYSGLKEQFRRHPNFKAFFDIPNAEATLDQQVLQMPPNSINVNSITGLMSQIYGYMQLNGMVQQQQSTNNQYQPVVSQQPQLPLNNQPMNQPNQQITPPHLRPSAPPMPQNGGQNLTPKGNPRRQLTELERRVARENNFKSDDEYIDFLHEDATSVYRSDIGQVRNP
jgi:hypothetical protein